MSTKDNVEDFFTNEYPRYQAMSQLTSLLQSQQISDMPSNHSNTNNTDDQFNSIIHAREVIRVVNRVIQSIPAQWGRHFLELRIQGLTWLEIEERTGYSTRQGQRNLNRAYETFACMMDDGFIGLLPPFREMSH